MDEIVVLVSLGFNVVRGECVSTSHFPFFETLIEISF
jgi:hypothetical protein